MSRSSRSDFGRRNVSPVFCFLTVWTMILSSVHYHLCFARVLQWASTLSSGLNWSSGWQEWNTHTHTTEPGQWIGLKHIGESMYMHYKYIYIYIVSQCQSYHILSYHIISITYTCVGGELEGNGPKHLAWDHLDLQICILIETAVLRGAFIAFHSAQPVYL